MGSLQGAAIKAIGAASRRAALAAGRRRRQGPRGMAGPPSTATWLPLRHRLWRRLPASLRRQAYARVTAALAPLPEPSPPLPCTGVAVAGELQRASGLGQGARLMIAALRALEIPVWEIDEADAASAVPPPGVPLILHVNSPALPGFLLRLPRALIRQRRVIGYWAWELPVAPPAWKTGLPFVHEIWAPSRFTADALGALVHGAAERAMPIRIVPHPVAVQTPCPSALTRADFGLPEDAFVVLTSFSLASSFTRKNPLAAITAFRRAFGDRPDRILVLKLSHTEHWPHDLAILHAAAAGAANIRIDTRTVPYTDHLALTRCADVVLSLHRSEGFGLVPAEAMLLGKPVIATNWSATAEFIDAGNGVPVPYNLIPAIDPRGVFEAPGAVWADADADYAAAAMLHLAAHPEHATTLGRQAAASAQSRFTGQRLRQALHAIGLGLAA